MSYVIAVAGKGGMGKTTVAALVIEVLKQQGRKPILAVDADPNATLGDWLGIKCGCTVADILEETKGLRNLPDAVSKPQHLEYQIQQALTESPGVDLLVMGRPEGPDCYCMANNMLRGYVGELAKSYPYIVIDNEAGMEHLNRKTTQNIDALLLVSDPTRIGLRTTQRIKELIDKLTFLTIRRKYLVLNRVKVGPPANPAPKRGQPADPELPLLAELPLDSGLQELELTGRPISALPADSPLFQQARALVERLITTSQLPRV